MSLILSIETATKICSVALHENEKLLSEANVSEDYSHFEKLPKLIREVFDNSEYKLQEISAVAVSKGPGSYTGLRIGVSMAKGISFALGVPLISVNTLEAMAYSAKEAIKSAELFCPMIDARREEVYCTIVDKDMKIIWPVQALVVTMETFDSILENQYLLLFGDGSKKFKSIFQSKERILFENIEPTADSIGRLALKKFQRNEFEDRAYFEPFYLKNFQPGLSKKNLTL